jgi:peptide/nickel transport system permease protein
MSATGFMAAASPLRPARPLLIPTLLIILLIAAVLTAPSLAPYDPDRQDLLAGLLPPSSEHWLGTDEQGRDLLSRILFGLRVDLVAAIIAVSLGFMLGVPVGAAIGFLGGVVDRAVSWLLDAALAIPPIILIFAVVAALGRGLTQAMIALGIVFSFSFVRLARGQVLLIRDALYVQAANAAGVGRLRIVGRHVLPSAMPALLIQVGLLFPVAFLIEATLSYLGLSVQPPQSSLGSILQSAQAVTLTAPWQIGPPGVVLAGVAITLNALVNTVGGVLRPRPSASAILRSAAGRRTIATAPPAATRGLLSMNGLTVSVSAGRGRARLVVRDVSLSVEPGEVLAIVGESGSGKTLTAMSVLGLLPDVVHIVGGDIEVDGRSLVGAVPELLREVRIHHVGVIFQDPIACLNPAYTVGSQLIEPLVVLKGLSRAKARERVTSLLNQVGITECDALFAQYPKELSGGIAQRVMIALALSREPQLLIADEATSALDMTVQAQVIALLDRLRRERGLSMLFVTHNMGVAQRIADRIAVMYAGEVVETGLAADIITRPAHPYTRALLEAVPRNEPRRRALAPLSESDPRWASDFGCRFAPRCPHVFEACVARPIALRHDGLHAVRCILGDRDSQEAR